MLYTKFLINLILPRCNVKPTWNINEGFFAFISKSLVMNVYKKGMNIFSPAKQLHFIHKTFINC